ncbi:type II secretion system F family protein [Sulfurimonas sp.]
MAELKIMTPLHIDILLILIITCSATALGYIFLVEYQRTKHINYIKHVISLVDVDEDDILREKHLESKNTLKNKVNALMLRAGFRFSPYIFVLIFLAFCFLSGSLFALFLRHWSGYVIGVPFGAFIFYMILQAIIDNRKKKFNKALAVAISVLVKMMKNGIGFEQALSKSVSVSGSKLFRDIFAKFFQEKNTIGEMEAFNNLNQFIHSKELRIFALAIKIGRESGGQFSNTLEKVEKTISYREKMQEKVDVVTRESSVGSYVVVLITIFLYFSLNGNFDGKLHHYFMESPYGRFELLGIAMWVFTGIMINKMLTKVNK